MTLYTKNNQPPRELPFRIVLSDGSTRTDPTTFTPEEIADAGYAEAPVKPEGDTYWSQDLGAWVVREPFPDVSTTQTAEQDAAPTQINGVWTLGWTVRDKTTEEIEAEHQAKVGLVAAEWQRRVDIGDVFAVTGVADPIPVPGRQPYREIIQAKLSAAQLFAAQGITDPVVMFRDGDNTSHMLTPAQMIELCIASMRFYEALSEVYWAMKDGTGDFTGGIPADFTDDSYWP